MLFPIPARRAFAILSYKHAPGLDPAEDKSLIGGVVLALMHTIIPVYV